MGAARKAVLFWLGAMGLSLLLAGHGFREDELECEQAVAHLVDCCPGFPADSVQCESGEGCGTIQETALSVSESQCIEARSCADIQSSGLCKTVEGLVSPILQEDDAGAFEPTEAGHPTVCP